MIPESDEQRCLREIAEAEALLRAGHPDVAGLTLCLSDWHRELRLIRAAQMRRAA